MCLIFIFICNGFWSFYFSFLFLLESNWVLVTDLDGFVIIILSHDWPRRAFFSFAPGDFVFLGSDTLHPI